MLFFGEQNGLWIVRPRLEIEAVDFLASARIVNLSCERNCKSVTHDPSDPHSKELRIPGENLHQRLFGTDGRGRRHTLLSAGIASDAGGSSPGESWCRTV